MADRHGGHVSVNIRALVVFAVFVAMFAALLRSPAEGEVIVHAVIWALIAAMSVLAIALAILRGGTRGQDAVVPRWLGRWLVGESDDDRREREEWGALTPAPESPAAPRPPHGSPRPR